MPTATSACPKVMHVAEVGKSQCGLVMDRLNELERTLPEI
jgi:hypothetical protein